MALRVIATPLEGSAGVAYAENLGLLKKYGLSVQVQIANSGEAAAAAVIGGSADIAIGTVLNLTVAHQRGIPLSFIAPAVLYVGEEPGLVVSSQSTIDTASGLTGKTIASQAVGDLNTLATRLWLDKNGGDSASVRFTELPTPQMAAAIGRGTVDAAVIATPALNAALASKCCRVLTTPYSAIAKRFLLNGWFAKNDWIAAHREAARRFARAVGEAQQWSNSDRADSAKILAGILKIDLDVLKTLPRDTFADRLAPELIQPVIDVAARYHVTAGPFPASGIYVEL